MFRSYRDDFWSWSPLSQLRNLDDDFRRLFDQIWNSPSYCDSNGVLTLPPSYRLKQTKSQINIEIDIPGVNKQGVAVESQGNRLKIIAAKYSSDERSCACTKNKKDSKKDKNASNLPSLVYKLHLRLSSKADLDRVHAKYKGDGLLHVSIPVKEEQVRKINVDVHD